jgi:hypothetical protein
MAPSRNIFREATVFRMLMSSGSTRSRSPVLVSTATASTSVPRAVRCPGTGRHPVVSVRSRPEHPAEGHHRRSGGRYTQAEAQLPASPHSSLFLRRLWVRTGRHPCDLCRLCRGAPHADGSRPLSLQLLRPHPSPRPRQPGLALRRVVPRVSRQCCCPCSTRARVCRRPVKKSVLACQRLFNTNSPCGC